MQRQIMGTSALFQHRGYSRLPLAQWWEDVPDLSRRLPFPEAWPDGAPSEAEARKPLFFLPSTRTLVSFQGPEEKHDHWIWGQGSGGNLLTAVCMGDYPIHLNLGDKLRRVLFGENGFSAIVQHKKPSLSFCWINQVHSFLFTRKPPVYHL